MTLGSASDRITSYNVCYTKLLRPLCQFNLEDRQKEMAAADMGFKPLPVLYFTELLALALGEGEAALDLAKHVADPRPALAARGALEASRG